MPKITSEMLLQAGACDFFQKKFEADFPDGLDFNPADRRLLARLVEMGYGSVIDWPERNLGERFCVPDELFPPLRIGDLDEDAFQTAAGYAMNDILYDGWQEGFVEDFIESVERLGIVVDKWEIDPLHNEVNIGGHVNLLDFLANPAIYLWPEWLGPRPTAYEKAWSRAFEHRSLVEESARLSPAGTAYVSLELVPRGGPLGSGGRTELRTSTSESTLFRNIEEAILNDAEAEADKNPDDEAAIMNNASIEADSVHDQIDCLRDDVLECVLELLYALQSHLNSVEDNAGREESVRQWASENDVWFSSLGEPIGYGPAVVECYING